MTRATLDNFELALLADLRAHVAERSVPEPARRPLLRVAAPIAAAAAVATAVALAVGAAQPSPAFAVERQGDGDVVVTVMDWSDTTGLERALEREGVTADVEYDATAKHSSDLGDGSGAGDCPAVGDVLVDPADGGGVTFTLDARFVAAHQADLHLTAAGGRVDGGWMAVSVTWVGAAC